jgi:hypothetical protein
MVVVGYTPEVLTVVAKAIEDDRPELTVIALEDPQHTALVLAARLAVGAEARTAPAQGSTHAAQ